MTSTLKHSIEAFLQTMSPNDPRREMLERCMNPPAERELANQLPLYPSRKAKRESLCQLRWKHLQHVDSMACDPDYNRSELHDKLLGNFDYFFGRLRRRRRDEVPSDQLRRCLMVSQILDQVDARRAWLEQAA